MGIKYLKKRPIADTLQLFAEKDDLINKKRPTRDLKSGLETRVTLKETQLLAVQIASSRAKTRSRQSQTCVKYRGIVICIKIKLIALD